MAVLPVPGGPASNKALPAIFLALIRSTATPAALIKIMITYLAIVWPTMPWDI
jgi:hypothetical protein